MVPGHFALVRWKGNGAWVVGLSAHSRRRQLNQIRIGVDWIRFGGPVYPDWMFRYNWKSRPDAVRSDFSFLLHPFI
jgi:hypothetical protein